MFGKLLKNDLKAQWHSISVIYLTAIIVTAAAEALALFSPNKVLSILGGLLVMLALGVTCLITIIAVILLFRNTLFGRAGYLSLTLPVKTGSLVRSKTLSGLIWIFCTYLLFIGSFVLLAYQAQKAVGAEIQESVEQLLTIFGVPSFFTIFIGSLVLCVMFAAVILLLVQCAYLAVTLSHVSPLSKLGGFGAVVMFFLFFGVLLIVISKISGAVPFGLIISEHSLVVTTELNEASTDGVMVLGLTGTLLQLAAGIGLHFPIAHFLRSKVNIK